MAIGEALDAGGAGACYAKNGLLAEAVTCVKPSHLGVTLNHALYLFDNGLHFGLALDFLIQNLLFDKFEHCFIIKTYPPLLLLNS